MIEKDKSGVMSTLAINMNSSSANPYNNDIYEKSSKSIRASSKLSTKLNKL